MIIRDNYGEDHIKCLMDKSHKDPQLIERALYALGLLEALAQTGLEFIFKGGSCLMLILPRIMRLSTDIDIVVSPGTDVQLYIERAAEIFPFVSYEEQIRFGRNNIQKKHFKFTYYSPVRHDDYTEYIEGIRGVETHIFSDKFTGETASYRASNIIYMASCLLTETPYEFIDDYRKYTDEPLIQEDLRMLSKMRKAQPLQYAYLVKADKLLTKFRN